MRSTSENSSETNDRHLPEHTRAAGRIGVFLPALEGGGERVMLDLAQGFWRRGLQVDLILSIARRGDPFSSQVPSGIRMINLNALGAGARLRGLVAYLRRTRPDALITFYDFFNIAAIARRIARAPTLIISGVHNTVSELFRQDDSFKMRARRILFGPLLHLSDHVVAVSRGVAADLESAGIMKTDKTVVIYNPVLLDHILLRAGERVSHPFFSPGAPPVVIGMGQLAPRKGFTTLIEAFALLRQKLPATLTILGEGPQRQELESLAAQRGISECVSFPGLVENPYAYLARASAFVLSSRFEGLGMALVEALALGVPCVSTNCPSGPAEILENGMLGALVPVDDPAALARAIADALHGPRLNGRVRIVRERFSLDRAITQYLALIYPPVG